MRIGELSERSGVPTKTIRYWEQSGLVAEPARTGSGYRDYHDDTLAVLRFVRSAQAAGFTVAEIAQIIDIRSRGEAPCEHVTTLIERHLADIDQRMAELRQVRTQLRALAATADALDPARCTDAAVCQIIDNALPSPPAGRRRPPTPLQPIPRRARVCGGDFAEGEFGAPRTDDLTPAVPR